uniref:Cullin N-terminal domain-containing protein n=1 Tax=Leersia perrieri TaxID=77586 RepID=A0A0D9WA76_9ORYZ
MTPSRHYRIQSYCFNGVPMDAATAAGNCKAVTDAIRDIYAQEDMGSLVFEELYRCAYNLVLHGQGELLYTEMEKAMAAEVEGIRGSLSAVADDSGEFLQELLSKWHLHTKAVAAIRDIVKYMDRMFVVANGKASVHDLGVKIWRDSVVCSGDVMPRLVEAVRRERPAAEEPAGDVMAGVDKMLAELGDEVHRGVMDASSADE